MIHAPVADDITVGELERDPYPVYERLRREAPVCFVPAVDLWFVTRWEDVIAGAEAPGMFPASMSGSPLDRTLGGINVLTVDGAEHERLREPMENTLRPRKVEDRAPAIVQRIADELLDAIADRGGAELMSTFCEPLSVLSLAEMIGLRGLDAPTLQRWFHEIAGGTSNYEGDPSKQRVADATVIELNDTLRPLFAQLLEHPDATMISDMLHNETGDLDARMRGFIPTLGLMLIGGLQEPGHGLGSTLYGLLSHSDQGAAFRADPAGTVKHAADEGLRWVSPIGTQGRAAGPGVVVRGVEIPEGAPVGLMVPSANRDRDVWGPTADAFDMFRPRHAHAAFGFGPHFCVGHYLARVQMRVSLLRIFERLPGLRLDPDRPSVFQGWEYRGPAELNVLWG